MKTRSRWGLCPIFQIGFYFAEEKPASVFLRLLQMWSQHKEHLNVGATCAIDCRCEKELLLESSVAGAGSAKNLEPFLESASHARMPSKELESCRAKRVSDVIDCLPRKIRKGADEQKVLSR